MNIEELIEKAVQDIMQARTYISTNSIQVVRFRDRLTGKGDAYITVHALPFERLSNNHDLYKATLDLLADSKAQADVKAVTLDAMYAECADELNQTITPATLQAAIDAVQAGSGITIDGFNQLPGDDTDGDYQIIRAKTDIFLTYVKPT